MENFSEINYKKNMNMLSQAVKYCKINFLHDDLINELYHNNDLKKQLCIILISKLNSQAEADALVCNLTGKSGPVRETTACKILELIKNPDYQPYFQTQNITDAFIKAVTDINPSVSRNITETIKYVLNAQYIFDNIIKEIKASLNETLKIKKNRSYLKNRKNFGLYWNLEAVAGISDKIQPDNELLEILKLTALSDDYTIREKTAKTARCFISRDNRYSAVLDLLKNDNNIYVKKYID